ncbi:nuclear transport factor 2 family protein [Nocardioides sp. GCM10027113]|uniref:nuclear transport factor 2 family protein n=1 Tax=unclassified Nocardioides TaxID=2615069 RepID=UPI00361F4ADD
MKTDPRATSLATLVADRDLEELGRRLTADVRVRAMLPGGPVEQHGRDEVLRKFDDWFGDYRTVVLEDAAGELVGDRLLVHYRLRFEPDESPRVLTQTWVSSLDAAGLLFRIDLVCSGFREAS